METPEDLKHRAFKLRVTEELLDELRHGSRLKGPLERYTYQSHVEEMSKNLSDLGFKLEDVGTNEVELEELRIKCIKQSAKLCLDRLRDGAGYGAMFNTSKEEIEKMRGYLKEGNLTLEDIDVNEEKLEELRKKYCLTTAKKTLDRIRRGEYPRGKNEWWEVFDSCSAEGGFSIKDVEPEMDEIKLEELRSKTQ